MSCQLDWIHLNYNVFMKILMKQSLLSRYSCCRIFFQHSGKKVDLQNWEPFIYWLIQIYFAASVIFQHIFNLGAWKDWFFEE